MTRPVDADCSSRRRREASRSRTITWTDPARVRASDCRGLDGYERLAPCNAASSLRRRPSRCSACQLDEVERGPHRLLIVADELHENPMGTMHGGIVADVGRHRDGLRGVVDAARRRRLHDARAEARTSSARSRRRPDACTPKAGSCTAADASRPPKHASRRQRARSTRTRSRRACILQEEHDDRHRRTETTTDTLRVDDTRVDRPRPITIDDVERLRRDVHAGCRPTSVHFRFFSPINAAAARRAAVAGRRRPRPPGRAGGPRRRRDRGRRPLRRPPGAARRRPRSRSRSRTPGSTGASASAWPGGSAPLAIDRGLRIVRGDDAARQPGRARARPQARPRRDRALRAGGEYEADATVRGRIRRGGCIAATIVATPPVALSATCRCAPDGRRAGTRSAVPTTSRRPRTPCCRRDRARARARARCPRADRSRHTRCASATRSTARPRARSRAPARRSGVRAPRVASRRTARHRAAPRACVRRRTPSGSGSSARSNPSGARTSARRAPGLMPSFWGRGVPEYPATRSQSIAVGPLRSIRRGHVRRRSPTREPRHRRRDHADAREAQQSAGHDRDRPA